MRKRTLITLLIVVLVSFSLVMTLSAQGAKKPAPKAPEKLVFEAKTGKVTYNHAMHLQREKGDCNTCHDKLFSQTPKAPLNFAAGMHKTAEAKKSSCAACHVAGGKAFETKANCTKCHVKT
jgi:c(7)-type cytochrome triheme protein